MTEMESCQRFSSYLEESAYELRSSFQLKKSSQLERLEREEKQVSLMYEHHINYLAYTI